MARTFGVPNRTTEETWSATAGSSGLGTVAGSTPSGTLFRSDEAHHGRALRVAAQHHLGVGAALRHGVDMRARVSDAVESGGPVVAGRVVDGIDVERPWGNTCSKIVDECLSGRAETGCFTGAAGVHDLHVGGRLRTRRVRRPQKGPKH